MKIVARQDAGAEEIIAKGGGRWLMRIRTEEVRLRRARGRRRILATVRFTIYQLVMYLTESVS